MTKAPLFFTLLAITLAILFYRSEEADGHYDDKGYRLCMHAIVDGNSSQDTVRSCLQKYAGIQGNN